MRQTLVADLTVNTDFAQVEDDQQVVNLPVQRAVPREARLLPRGRRDVQLRQRIAGTGGTGGGGGTQGSSQNTSTAPLLFYSRRIGFANGLTVPIWAGGRLLGRSGPWQYGLLNMQTGESNDANAPSTNFSVVRVNHDLFRRSRVGAIVTRRDPVATAKAGGIRTRQSGLRRRWPDQPDQRHQIVTYAAKTQTEGQERKGHQLPRTVRLDAGQVRAVGGVPVGRDELQPGGRVPAPDRVRTIVRPGAVQSAPRLARHMRKIYFLGSVDYITDPRTGQSRRRSRGVIRWTSRTVTSCPPM